MQAKSINIGRALSVGFEAFKRYPGAMIGVSVLYCVFVLIAQEIDVVKFVYNVFIQPPIAGGLVIFALNAINDRNPTVGDLFAGFQEYWKWMGTYWLYTAIVFVCILPAVTVGGIGAALSRNDTGSFVMVTALAVLVSLVILIAVMLRWMLVYYAAAEGAGTIDAFTRSAQLTEGVRPQLLLAAIVLGLFSVCGVIALGIGVIVTFPIAMCAFAAIYRDLKTAMGAAEAPSFAPAPGTAPVTSGPAPTPTVIHAPGLTPPAATSTPGQPAAAPPPPSPVQWHLVVGGQRVGPLSPTDLMARIEAGEVTGETLVWRAGMADWAPAAQTPELAPLLSAPPGGGPPASA